MNRYILSAVVILLSFAIAETEEVKPQARSLEMSEEYKAQRERDLNRTFDSRNTIVVDQFGGGEGYWITVNEDILFQYSTSTQTVTLKKNEVR